MKFTQRCYALLKKVPAGKVTTYADIAHALGTKAYRAVGNAMNANPHNDVPCHRVVRSDGMLGGFVHGTTRKKELLAQEGIVINHEHIDLEKYRHFFE